MALSVDDLADLVKITQKDLGKGKWTDLTGDLQKYYAMPSLMKEKRIEFGSGTHMQWNAMMDDNGNARNVGAFSVDNVAENEKMDQAYVPWRHTETKWAWDVLEFKTNRSPAKIVDIIKTRTAGGKISLAKRMETDFWSAPTSTTDDTTPYGLFYYLVFDDGTITTACGTTGAFCAANPYPFSDCATIDATADDRWSNWSCAYVTVDEDDFLAKVRMGMDYTEFHAPIAIPEYTSKPDRAFYTVHSVKTTLERLMRQNNDNLGADLAKGDNGGVTIRQAPIYWVPQLGAGGGASVSGIKDGSNAAVVDPFIQIDWTAFKLAFLEGDYMEMTGPVVAPNQHRVVHQFLDCTWQAICYDRRRLAIYAI